MHKIIANERVKIEKLVPGGQGIATLASGKKAFFWNALPGEIITQFEIFKQKSKYIEAVALQIEEKSPHRIQPKDDIYLSTSPWQIMDYTYELDQKLSLLEESFKEAGLDCPAEKVKTDGKQFHYRNKMEYSLYWDLETEEIKLAFRKRGTHQKIPIKQSSLERPEIYQKALAIINDLNLRGEEAYKYQSLLLRSNQHGKVSGGLYENHKPHPTFPPLTDKILENEYSYSPNGFFQINLPLYEMALTAIKTHITTQKVLDLYAGVGTIGLSIAKDQNLTLVEVNNAAYAELLKNCEAVKAKLHSQAGMITDPETRLASPQPILAKSEDSLAFIATDQTVIVDPPRAGCDIKLLEKILAIKPQTVVYLSCNPSTQARDLKILKKAYTIEKLVPFNFFPRTPHLENLAILSVI